MHVRLAAIRHRRVNATCYVLSHLLSHLMPQPFVLRPLLLKQTYNVENASIMASSIYNTATNQTVTTTGCSLGMASTRQIGAARAPRERNMEVSQASQQKKGQSRAAVARAHPCHAAVQPELHANLGCMHDNPLQNMRVHTWLATLRKVIFTC